MQKFIKHCIILIVFVTLLPACAKSVRCDISVFHEIPATFAGTTYATLPLKGQEGSLEHKTYEQMVKRQLNAKGFREAPVEQADVLVFILYGIDTGKEVVGSYPIIGQTGISSSHSYGTAQSYGSYGTYSGVTTYAPSYGVVGTGVTSQTVYTRFLKLDIVDNKASTEKQLKKLYEAKVISPGTSGQLSAVLPTMIEALFQDFPGKSGSARRRTLHLRHE
ncbi:MAG: DUF4136 domain-containing protein [Syntrophales bacterium]|jgi:hypothetical protein